VHCIAHGERPEINCGQAGAVDQVDHHFFGFGIVSGSKDDGTGFVRRKTLVVRKNDIWQLSGCSLELIFMVKAAQYKR
jgi:hypothetical protein